MNNLEGWGGPNPDSWYTQQEALQKKILKRMREYGIEPVFPGYSGMVPHDANKKLGLNVTEPALWNGFTRPAFLLPTDSRFNEIASLYYKELEKLFGKANYYSMDPFHELEDAGSVDFDAAGKAVLKAMKDVNPKATWVIQGWTENPRPEMIKNLNNGDILILDLFSECRPMWGIPSIWKREKGYEQHDWLFCMIENFGGNVGLHGRMDQLLNNFYITKNNPLAAHLKGIGLTMEGSENNPVMFELMCELPWRPEKFTKEEWLKDYLFARYGVRDEKITQAWSILADGIYNCPFGNNQQGPHESIFCGRPGLNNFQASSWSKMQNYYDPTSTEAAARLMLEVADKYKGNNNFEYDLVDIVRQSLSDRGRIVYNQTIADFKSFDKKSFAAHSQEFLNILLAQDRLLGTRSEFRVGRWIEQARNLGTTPEEKDLYEWNARVQITTWGNRVCANDGGLRDYAHKEWNGILKDFYYKRWAAYWQTLQDVLDGKPMVELDYYAMEEPWTLAKNPYSAQPEGDCISVAKEVFNKVFKINKELEIRLKNRKHHETIAVIRHLTRHHGMRHDSGKQCRRAVSYAPLRHSVWNGLTPCDLVFPFFLFMVGISTYISLRKFNFEPTHEVVKKIFRRMFLIILIGLGIEWFGYACDGNFLPFDTLRIPGVLQRIGLCYGIVSLMVVYLNHKYLPWITAGLLVAYSVLLLCGNGYACDDTNLIAIIDRSIFGEAHLYKKSPIDPEGLIGTISAVAHTLIGFFCGKLLLGKNFSKQTDCQTDYSRGHHAGYRLCAFHLDTAEQTNMVYKLCACNMRLGLFIVGRTDVCDRRKEYQ